MAYSIVIEPAAIQDIQQAIDYYNEQQIGLSKKFEASLNNLSLLRKTHSIKFDMTMCIACP